MKATLINVNVATREWEDKRDRAQTSWPLVHPELQRVPGPTSNPVIIRTGQGAET
ncbi:hypothetical protein [Mangrovibacter phragmitis]|uniref:hypothetical protein n=1 Tax=Mangrovibacter phragmitis TaxID=1691903 RepID=UPI00336AD394